MHTVAKEAPPRADVDRITTRSKNIAALLLPIIALVILALPLMRSFQPAADLYRIGFYPTEMNTQIDYAFARSHAGILLPERPAKPAQLIFRVFSPEPLPPRSLTLRYDSQRVDLPAIGAAPRIVHVALPAARPDDPRGLLIELATAGARSSGDGRDLGLLFDYIQLQAPGGNELPWAALATTILLVGIYLLMVRLGEDRLFAGIVLLALSALLLIDQRLCWLGCALVAAGWLWARWRSRVSLSEYIGRRMASLVHPDGRYTAAVAAIGLVYSIAISFYSIATYSRFRADTYDLGNFDQTLWLASRFIYPYNTGTGLHVMGDHASFLLYPLAALYWISADVRLLLVVQSIVVALGVVPICLLAKQHQQPLVGVIVAVAYLLHPATINMNLFDFHPDALAATALLFAIWGIERRRWWVVALACLIILGAKENFAVTVAFLGVWMIARRMWSFGAALLVVSLGWFFVATRLIVPALNGQPETVFFARFAQYGNNVPEIAAFMLFHPQVILADLLQPSKVWYVGQLLLPFALLPLLSPRYLVLAAPALSLNLLSNFSPQQTLLYHYNALIVPVAAVACVMALVWLLRWVSHRRFAMAGAAIVLVGCSVYALAISYSRLSQYYDRSDRDAARIALYDYVVSLVPAEASVSAQSNLQPHLAHRVQAFMFPNPFQRVAFFNPAGMPYVPQVDYIVYDAGRPDNFYAPAKAKLKLLAELQARGLYRPVLNLDGVMLLRRSDAALDERCFGIGWDAPQCNFWR